MTVQEADAPGIKPFQASGEPGDVDPGLAASLGVTLPEAQSNDSDSSEDSSTTEESSAEVSEVEKNEEKSDKVLDNYSAKIQEHSEELYASLSYRSKNEEGFLDKLIASDDTLDRKMAKKILNRNSDHFGVDNIEDYEVKRAKESVGDNQTAQKLAIQEAEIKSLKKKQSDSDWQTWKTSRQVESDSKFDTELNEIHSEHPELPYTDVIMLAKGRLGDSPVTSKDSASTTMGSSGAPQEDDILSSPLASRLLGNMDKESRNFARDYAKSYF